MLQYLYCKHNIPEVICSYVYRITNLGASRIKLTNIPATKKLVLSIKVCQHSHIKADATPVMNKSFEKLLSNNFQVIIFERMAKNCFKVNILSKICQNICFSIKKVLIFYFLIISIKVLLRLL